MVNCGSTSTGYASGTAVGKTIAELTGVEIRVIPGASLSDRVKLLQDKNNQIAMALSSDVWFGLDGIYEFEEVGPQSLREIWMCGAMSQGFGVRGDSGILVPSDLRGKKVPYYVGYTSQILAISGLLSYGNLTWDDVEKVPVSGYMSGYSGVLDGSLDVASMACESSKAYEIDASLHGVGYLQMPYVTDEDKAAWARMHEWYPTYFPKKVTAGAGIEPGVPQDLWGWNYQTIAYDSVDENLVYWYTSQVHQNYDAFKDKHAYAGTWTIEAALDYPSWAVPYHEGSVKYFKDIGRWTSAMEAKQQQLLADYPQKNTRP